MTSLLASRRCHCERRFSDGECEPCEKLVPCGMRLVKMHGVLVCACCDLFAERP